MNSYLASLGAALANHLWQSTAVLALALLLTLALRRSPARVRHTIWVVASAKFLVPFSLLIAAGNLLPHPRETVGPAVYPAMEAVEEPFAVGDEQLALKVVHTPTLRERIEVVLPESLGVVWALGAGTVLLVWMSRGSVVRRTRRAARPAHHGREFEILQRAQERFVTMRHRVLPLRLSSEHTEPGIFGVFLPVLVWPEALSARLEDEHIEAIMAHELMHVRRRDNLTAALHMLVEVLFWFHPLVWWMERQLVKEREQACDEAVIEMGGDEETYAESLLKTCRFCLESPLPCVAGVTGGELKQRINSILTLRPNQLGRAGRFTLLTILLGTVAAPLALGLVHRLPVFGQILRSTGPRPSYEVVSIRPWRSLPPVPDTVGGEQVVHQTVVKFSPGNLGGQRTDRVHMITPLGVLVAQAYGLPPGSDGRANGRIVGGPDWMTRDSEQYEIQAKIEDQEFAAMQKMSPQQQREQVNLMNQSLLEQRFKLKVHFETRELPAYALVVAKGGPKLTPAKPAESTQLTSTRRGQTTELTATSASLTAFANSPLLTAGTGSRPVIDQTGLNGKYDFTLKWSSEFAATGQPSDEPSLLSAIQEQLGLKLVPTKGPVEVIVVDHIEKPTVDGAEVAPASQILAPISSFEVATIKPSRPDTTNSNVNLTTGRFTTQNIPLELLLKEAYGLNSGSSDQIVGIPGWVRTSKWDIEAKEDPVTASELEGMPFDKRMVSVQPMLQALLADRFRLRAHVEMQTRTVAALVIAKRGLHLQTFSGCSGAPSDPPCSPDEWQGIHNNGHGHIEGRAASLAMLANLLAMQPEIGGRMVVDATGFGGKFNFDLHWTPYSASGGDSSGPSLFAALQEQLGLKLETKKLPIKVLVIDHVEQPTAN